jgi:MATE family multidrug resistance protein
MLRPVPGVPASRREEGRQVAEVLIWWVAGYHLFDALQVVAVNSLRGNRKSTVPMVIYTVTLWGIGLGGGYILGLTDLLGEARGAAGFWTAGMASLTIVGLLVAYYLDSVSKESIVMQSRQVHDVA